ncbi:hypothetical protein [Pseudoduganella sp.]|uniref:hypothetical protein n=1 Tax=Pseudoduganella sp. TaxID=1880898 RepID=UPI0035AF3C3C
MPAPGTPLQRVAYYWNSDVGYLFPGVKLKNDVVVPNLPASIIKECVGKQCFPEFAEFADLVVDTTRFENPAAPARRRLGLQHLHGDGSAPWSPF